MPLTLYFQPLPPPWSNSDKPPMPATYTPKAELRELTESPVAHRASYAVDEGASATVVFAETEPPTDEESTVTFTLIVAGACGDAAC